MEYQKESETNKERKYKLDAILVDRDGSIIKRTYVVPKHC
jgi:hypothetical protein